MSKRGDARARLIRRARDELPVPGDPRQLMSDLVEQDAAGAEALEVVSRTSLAWMQLRDLRLERAWQGGFGWFLARNVMVFAILVLPLALTLRPPEPVTACVLIGAGAYYLLVMVLSPLRIRRHKQRRNAILAAYGQDLSDYLDSLRG
ncbi:MAG: hypothetical protein ACYTCU_09995 [Planctomycetota bacterium]